MHTLRLQSLNVKPEQFLLLLYHATGLGFIFEWETLNRPVVFIAEEFERRQSAASAVLDSALRACASVRIETRQIFPDETRLAPDELHPLDKIFREEVETTLEFLRRLRRHDISPNVEDLGDLAKLRAASPPLADWLARRCRHSAAAAPDPRQAQISLLSNAASYAASRFPHLEPKFEASAPGVFGVLLNLGDGKSAFVTKEGDHWAGRLEAEAGGTSREHVGEFELPEQPALDDAPNLAEAILAAAGMYFINHGKFAVGQQVELPYGVDRHPDFFAPAGLRGTIDHLDTAARAASVKMDEPLEGCEEWGNRVCWDLEQFYYFALEVRRI